MAMYEWAERLLERLDTSEAATKKKLSAADRKALPASAFVFPKERRYPIHDLAHARAALARVAQHGTPAEKAKVRAAVYARYPKLKPKASTKASAAWDESEHPRERGGENAGQFVKKGTAVAEGTRSSGNPIKVPKGKDFQPARDALAIISKIHGFKAEPSIEIETFSSLSHGGFDFDDDGKPRAIGFNTFSKLPRAAIVHEIGHYIDHQQVGEPGTYESDNPDGPMADVLEAIRKSPSVEELETAKKEASSQPLKEMYGYLLEPSELFARAYAQYIAQKSGDELLQVEETLQRDHIPSEEFEPVVKALDKLLASLGGRAATKASDWEEREHPRDRGGENAGQFVEKGGGGGGSRSTVAAVADPVTAPAEEEPTPMARFREKGFKRASAADRKRLKLPPAWKHVHVDKREGARLLAVGVDKKGRVQRRYSSEHEAEAAAKKFAHLKAVHNKIGDIDHALSQDAMRNDTAGAAMLVRKMGLRPGSDQDTGAEVKAYGATNLRAGDVAIDGDTVILKFTGKKGVDLDLALEDAELARALRKQLRGKHPNQRLFKTNENKLRGYINSVAPGVKPKDLRTYLGTATALRMVKEMDVPQDRDEARQYRLAVAKEVSDRLGNTPKVALDSYIDPSVFASWDHLFAGPESEEAA